MTQDIILIFVNAIIILVNKHYLNSFNWKETIQLAFYC